MSQNDSLDEETKRLLAEVNTDDSKESNIPKKPQIKKYEDDEDTIQWETFDYEKDDDRDW